MSDSATAAEASLRRVLGRCEGGPACLCGGPCRGASTPSPSGSRTRTQASGREEASESSEGADFSSGSDTEVSSDGPIPYAIPVQDWDDLDSVTLRNCRHEQKVIMKRCRGGGNTGRRFLGCPFEEKEVQCDVVQWLDGPWPIRAQIGMSSLWKEIKVVRRRLQRSSETVMKLIQQGQEATKRAEKAQADAARTKEIARQICAEYHQRTVKATLSKRRHLYVLYFLLGVLSVVVSWLLAKKWMKQ